MRQLRAAAAASHEAPWATALHSVDAADEAAVAAGQIRIVLISERRATSPRFKMLLTGLHKAGSLLCVAIDEAHCISMWGPSFRVEYLQLGSLRQCVPGVPFLALTATASTHVRDDIIEHLQLSNPLVALESIYRENLFLAREPRPREFAKVQARAVLSATASLADTTGCVLFSALQLPATSTP